MKGSTLPRVYTQPLSSRREVEGKPGGRGCPCRCGLSPETSRGFEVIDWARKVLGVRLHPWQRWLLIHALELDEAGEYRFRIVLVLVARQNGKTLVKAILSLWRMFEGDAPYLVGTAQDLSQAREVMNEVLVPMILDRPDLRDRFDPDAEDSEQRVGIWHKTLNDEYFRLDSRWRGGRAVGPHGPRYLIKALNRKAGRGLSGVREVNIDELREQRDFEGWGAVSKVVMAAPDGPQIWCMSNAGDKHSLLLNHLRGVALGGTDPQMFHAEWSAEMGCELDDPRAWAQANPSLGYPNGLTEAAIRSALHSDPPNVFRTEVLCQFVDVMNAALDTGAWAAGADPAGAMPEIRPALCVEAGVDGDQVVALTAAPLGDGRVRLEVVGVWGSTDAARVELGELKRVIRPCSLGWYPKGPGASLGAAMRKLGGVELKGNAVSEAHMTLADYVDGRRVLHPDDPLVNTQVQHTGMVGTAESWIFDRGPGATHAVWAAAGALYLVLNNPPPPRRRRRIIVPE